MRTCVLDIFVGCLLAHGHNDLFMGEALGGHVDLRLRFVIISIDDLLYLINFLILQFWEHLLDFEHIYDSVQRA